MISLAHRTLFVHIPKCAGQSVEQAFLHDIDSSLTWTAHRYLLACLPKPPGWSDALPDRLAHLNAREYRDGGLLPPTVFRDFFKFAIVRDPLERIISMWRYLPGLKSVSFDAFACQIVPSRVANGHFFFRSQYSYLCDPETRACLVDELIPFSDLEPGFERVRLRLGMTARLGHLNRSDARPRPEVTDTARNAIRQTYDDDYLTFTEF